MTPNERPPDELSPDELPPGELTDRLSDYALGLLEPTEAAEIETLLARSEAARADLRSLNASLVTLTEAPAAAGAPGTRLGRAASEARVATHSDFRSDSCRDSYSDFRCAAHHPAPP